MLDQPLEGPVYFRSSNNPVPDVVVDLRSQVEIELVGCIDSVHKKGSEVSRVRTRFMAVPDVPVAKFSISLYGGKRGLIVNSEDICKTSRLLKTHFAAQNGRVLKSEPVIAAPCAKK